MANAVVQAGAFGVGVAYGIWNEISTKGNGCHTLSLGKPDQNDIILFEEDVKKNSKFMSEVKYRFSYSCRRGETITAVVAQDKWTDDTGGNPEVVSGGLGQSGIAIRVTSQFGRGFHFRFVVYGTRQ